MAGKFTRKELDEMVLAELEQAPKGVQSQKQTVGLRGLLAHARRSKETAQPTTPTPGGPRQPATEGMSGMRGEGALGVNELEGTGEVWQG